MASVEVKKRGKKRKVSDKESSDSEPVKRKRLVKSGKTLSKSSVPPKQAKSVTSAKSSKAKRSIKDKDPFRPIDDDMFREFTEEKQIATEDIPDGYRLPFHTQDRFQIDIDAGFNLIPCTNKCKSKVDKVMRVNGQALVHDVFPQFTDSEMQFARMICDLANKLKMEKKIVFPLGDKYSENSGVVVWILLDSMETRLRAFISHHPSVLNVSLPIGDVWIVLSDMSFGFLIERKTIADLHSSTLSKHKDSQIARFHQLAIPRHLIEWWIEFPTTPSFLCEDCTQASRKADRYMSDASLATTFASASNLHMRDGFQVVRTEHILDTIYSLLSRIRSLQTRKTYTRWQPHPEEELSPQNAQQQVNNVLLQWFAEENSGNQELNSHSVVASRKQTTRRAIKSVDLAQDSHLVCARTLNEFHGITSEVAADITRVYSSLRDLIHAYMAIETTGGEDVIKRLANMLTCVPRTNYGGNEQGKRKKPAFITLPQSSMVWLGLWAKPDQREAWLIHPANKQEQERLKRLAKKNQE